MRKYRIICFLVCVLFIFVMGACQSPVTTKESTTASGSSGSKVTILSRYASRYPKWVEMTAMISKNTGITIDNIAASSEYAAYVVKLTSALTIGDAAYDIVSIDELLGVTFIAAGYLEPIDDIIKPVSSNLLQTWVEGISKGADNHYYIAPSGFAAIYLYANKDMFKQANLSYPTSLDQLITTSQTLTNADKGIYGLGSAWKQGGYLFNDIIRNIYAFDGDFYDWNNQATKNAIQFMYDQVHTYKITPEAAISDDYSAGNQKFADNKYALMYQWQSIYTLVQAKWDEYEIIPIPMYTKQKTIINSWGLSISKYSNNKDAAKTVLKEFLTDAAQEYLLDCENTQFTSVLNSEVAQKNPVNQALAKYATAGVLYPRPMPTTVNEIQNIMESNVSSYISGQISLDKCCSNVNDGIADLKPKS